MHQRAKYKETTPTDWLNIENPVGTHKYDGANFWMSVAKDGSFSFISRRESVKGGYPDRTSQLPHLTDTKHPELAGHVYNVELIHTGFNKTAPESHRMLSGILNSLPPRSIETQQRAGPVRAVLHNVVNPVFATYKDKLAHMKKVEAIIGKPDLIFAATPHVGKDAIHSLIRATKAHDQEGVVVTSLTRHESDNPRFKIKHKLTYNLKVTKVLPEFDKYGNQKVGSMGALEVSDASGRVVAKVGTGFSRLQRQATDWLGKLIQVETMGMANTMLRMPVYNGDADGDIDLVE